MFTDPFTIPAENSAGVRTSTKNAPSFIISHNGLLSVLPNIAKKNRIVLIFCTICVFASNCFTIFR